MYVNDSSDLDYVYFQLTLANFILLTDFALHPVHKNGVSTRIVALLSW